MRRKVWIYFLTAMLATGILILGGSYARSCMGASEIYMPGIKLLEREVLTYRIDSWLGHSGDITMETGQLHMLADGTPVYDLTYTISTSPRASRLYILRGRINVVMDASNYLPIQYDENMKSGLGLTGGGDYEYRKLIYKRDENLMLSYKVENIDGVPGRGRRIPPNSHHFTTLIPVLMSTPLSEGKNLNFVLADRKNDATIRATVVRKEQYTNFDGTTRNAFVVSTTTDFGQDSIKGTKFEIWLDDEYQYPVRIDAKTKWGKITATLTGRTAIKDLPQNENSGNNSSKVEGDAASGKTSP